MSNEELYVPAVGERVEIVWLHPGDMNPSHGVGDVVTVNSVAEYNDSSDGPHLWIYATENTGCGVLCRVRPAVEAESAEDWARSRSACAAPLVAPDTIPAPPPDADDSPEVAALMTRVNEIGFEVTAELVSALEAFPPFHTAHEGYAVILEELDELWDEIKKKQSLRDPARLRKEAVQVAAMAIRFALECDGSK